MQSDSFGEFGGIAGRVLREAMGPGTWLTGFAVSLVIFICAFVLDQVGASTAAALVVPVLTALALARFALNGFAGEWGGTLFSTRGGPWTDTGLVAARFLALSAVWLLPLLLLGWRPEQVGEAVGAALMGLGGSKVLSLTTLAGSAAALTPPLLLIGAVSAERWSDLLSRSRWMRLFEDRLGDLFLIYAIYLGALAMTVALLFPVLTAVMFQSTDAAVVFGLGGLAYACGLSVTLLGRLCGFFAVTGLGPLETALASANETRPMAPISALPSPEAGAGRADVPAGAEAAAPATPATPATAATDRSSTASPTPATGNLRVVQGSLRPKPAPPAPLLDATAKVDAARQRSQHDPLGALAELEELCSAHQPNPRVLHALCELQWELGRRPQSFETAREAMPICLERGAVKLAAEMYALHLKRAEVFDLPSDQALEFADILRQNRRFARSEAVYRSLLDRDPDTVRIVKGLLQVADGFLHENVDYEHARVLYRFLIDHCGDSPLAVYMREGLAEAQRRLGQAS